jgi:hypothetical protein
MVEGKRRQFVCRLVGDMIGILRLLGIFWSFVPGVVMMVMVDGIGGASFG